MGLFRFIFGKKKEKAVQTVAIEESKDLEKQIEEEEEDTVVSTFIEEAPKEEYDIESADALSKSKSTKGVKAKGFGGMFEIKKSKDGRFVFNLFASNKVMIATSQI